MQKPGVQSMDDRIAIQNVDTQKDRIPQNDEEKVEENQPQGKGQTRPAEVVAIPKDQGDTIVRMLMAQQETMQRLVAELARQKDEISQLRRSPVGRDWSLGSGGRSTRTPPRGENRETLPKPDFGLEPLGEQTLDLRPTDSPMTRVLFTKTRLVREKQEALPRTPKECAGFQGVQPPIFAHGGDLVAWLRDYAQSRQNDGNVRPDGGNTPSAVHGTEGKGDDSTPSGIRHTDRGQE